MSHTLPPGPYDHVPLPGGEQAPWYVAPFDKHGHSKGPKTRQHLLQAVRDGGFSDVFLFSHGWNNDWVRATRHYRNFIHGFGGLRQERGIAMPEGYSPLLVGVFWPSTSLVFGEEKGPEFAAAPGTSVRDLEVAEGFDEVDLVAEDLNPDDVERFYELMQKDALDDGEVHELAEMLAPLYAEERSPEAVGAEEPPPAPEDLVEIWRQVARDMAPNGEAESPTGGFASPPAGAPTDSPFESPPPAPPEPALFGFDPRSIIRPFTVWKMKDRAGVVGSRGVSELLRDLLRAAPAARFHLVGHSYGCRALLSAVCAADLPRPVDSALLLQPAVNHWCFAHDVAGEGFPGGYVEATERCRLPVCTTFSRNDKELRRMFHLAVRRRRDLGEVEIAAVEPAPSRFAALGGYGPAGRDDLAVVDLKAPGDPYDFGLQREIWVLRGHHAISGHGDVSNPHTWWMLHELVRGAHGLAG